MNNVKHLACTGRLFFVSDIHGEIDTLTIALQSLGFNEDTDMCVCAGDLIDRGDNNLKTVNFFLEDKTGAYHSVVGNHDAFSFQGDAHLWVYNGGGWAFTELNDSERLTLATGLLSLPYVIEVEHQGLTYGVTHAGVPEELTWDELKQALSDNNPAAKEECTWMRYIVEYPNHYNKDEYKVCGVDYTIHGHTPVAKPLMVANRLHIDTGLVYGKYLTVTEVSNGEFFHHSFNIEGVEI